MRKLWLRKKEKSSFISPGNERRKTRLNGRRSEEKAPICTTRTAVASESKPMMTKFFLQNIRHMRSRLGKTRKCGSSLPFLLLLSRNPPFIRSRRKRKLLLKSLPGLLHSLSAQRQCSARTQRTKDRISRTSVVMV